MKFLDMFRNRKNKPDAEEREAFLCVTIDVNTKPPTVVGSGVYSEPAESLTGVIGYRMAGIWSAKGRDFEHARGKLDDLVEQHPSFHWLSRLKGARA